MPESSIYKSGYVAVVGRPNTGKSTLINALMEQKIAAVSPRPQTTRRTQLGILTLPQAQIILVDTPGLHIPHHKLGESMNQAAADSLQDADLVLWLVDASEKPTEEDALIAQRLIKDPPHCSILIGFNKTDKISGEQLDERQADFQVLLPSAKTIRLSAATGYGLPELTQIMIDALPEGEPLFDEELVTDLMEKEIATELIREAALLHLRDEVPHALAVRIDEFRERSEEMAYIAATLFIEKETQKGIVIGKGGEMLKSIGVTARQEIEAMSGRKVYLELRVKVRKNWRNSPESLHQFGYELPKKR